MAAVRDVALYHWQVDGVRIAHATTPTYILTDAAAGLRLSVRHS
ncbi:hypothetical protein [Nocardioides furvisabuli]|nr:hypothetical protein [Nocardioides furvisabuli]